MVTDPFIYVFNWAAWGSVIAGGVAALAISILMAMLGVALGFTVINPKSSHPLSGLGVAFGGWSFVSVLISMAAGGFVAGLLGGQRGLEYGFMVWALVLVVAAFFSSIAVGSAVKTVGTAMKGIGSGAAGMAESMGRGAAHAASRAVTELRDNVHLNLDTEKLNEKVMGVLRDTEVDTLQPEYLQQQMREARSDLRNALHQLSLNPSDAEQVISRFLETEKTRLEALTRDIDREAAVKTLMARRNIPQEEARGLVDDALSAYNHALHKAKESLAEARVQVEDAKTYLRDMAAQAREKADRWASAAAKAALAAAIALIIAAAVSMACGWWGARCSFNYWHHPAHTTYYQR